MDWNAERVRQALRRIAALLFLFAALAERAAGLPRAVRGPVLWILRRAESVAREFVTGEAGCDIPVAESAQRDAGPGEATRLALSFRSLAASLAVLIAQARCLVRPRPELEIHELSGRLPGLVRRMLAPDTS